jgi:hypothetical protein
MGDGSGHRGAAVRETAGVAGLLASLLFGGMAFGLAVALAVGGGSVGAIAVGFLALPVGLGVSLQTWRTVLMGWLIARLGMSAIRSGGDDTRFRSELRSSLAGDGDRRALPDSWVFVPVCAAIGAVADIVMTLAAEGNAGAAGLLLLAGLIVEGLILRRLAQRGLLPVPAE